MEFRDAETENDLAILAKMNLNLIRDEGHRNTMDESQLKERMKSWLSSDYKAVLFSENNEPIGYALWRKDEEFLYVRHFYIRPEDRGKGLGKAAFHWLRQNKWSQELQLRLEVLIGNQAGIAFWRAVGFEDYCITMEFRNDA